MGGKHVEKRVEESGEGVDAEGVGMGAWKDTEQKFQDRIERGKKDCIVANVTLALAK